VMLDRPDELALAMSKFLAEGPAAP
jgi:hypothetical protein